MPIGSDNVEHPLLNVLQTRNENLYHQANHLIVRAKEILPHTLSTFSSGTAHGTEHTTTVEKISYLVASNGLIDDITDYELFFHIISCHYHDLGMVGTESDNQTAEGRDQVRRDHAVRIAEKLEQSWEELGFDSPRTARILGEICRGHRPSRTPEGDATWDELEELSIVGVDKSVRTRLLAALIYAVDELHLGSDRAPHRVANWKDIRDNESRRHWRRHAAIHGPISKQQKLIYEVEVNTLAFDEDIRRNVLRKALKGMAELSKQLEYYGSRPNIPVFKIHWNIRPLIQLLVVQTLGDHQPRSKTVLEQTVLDLYQDQASKRTDLSSLAEENLESESELRTQISRVVSDMTTRRFLESSGKSDGGYRLSTRGDTSERIITIVRDADELDVLYKGAHASKHEFKLFQSEYGRHYIRDSVFPIVQRVFSLDLSGSNSDDPIRILVESCPEVSRIIGSMSAAPNIVVRKELAALTVMAGALSDVYRAPSIWLNKSIRNSFRRLSERYAPHLNSVLEFLEELALVTGLTPEEATACMQGQRA